MVTRKTKQGPLRHKWLDIARRYEEEYKMRSVAIGQILTREQMPTEQRPLPGDIQKRYSEWFTEEDFESLSKRGCLTKETLQWMQEKPTGNSTKTASSISTRGPDLRQIFGGRQPPTRKQLAAMAKVLEGPLRKNSDYHDFLTLGDEHIRRNSRFLQLFREKYADAYGQASSKITYIFKSGSVLRPEQREGPAKVEKGLLNGFEEWMEGAEVCEEKGREFVRLSKETIAWMKARPTKKKQHNGRLDSILLGGEMTEEDLHAMEMVLINSFKSEKERQEFVAAGEEYIALFALEKSKGAVADLLLKELSKFKSDGAVAEKIEVVVGLTELDEATLTRIANGEVGKSFEKDVEAIIEEMMVDNPDEWREAVAEDLGQGPVTELSNAKAKKKTKGREKDS